MGCAGGKTGPHRMMGVNFMPLFFISQDVQPGQTFTISGEDAHHIIRVLRYKTGDHIKLSDGENTEITALIQETDYKNAKIKTKIIEKNRTGTIRPKITLFQGMPKKDKWDFILQKNTELGVSKFVPVITRRTVVEFSEQKSVERKKRWERIVKEACKQCIRFDIPEIEDVKSFENCLKNLGDYDLVLVPWEQEKSRFLKEVFSEHEGKPDMKIAVFIGPEGGFCPEEIQKAEACGAVTVSLGPRILRTETASIVVCSAIMYELGDMGGQHA